MKQISGQYMTLYSELALNPAECAEGRTESICIDRAAVHMTMMMMIETKRA